jgi:hypothetical protein
MPHLCDLVPREPEVHVVVWQQHAGQLRPHLRLMALQPQQLRAREAGHLIERCMADSTAT